MFPYFAMIVIFFCFVIYRKSDESDKYLSFTSENYEPKRMAITYEVSLKFSFLAFNKNIPLKILRCKNLNQLIYYDAASHFLQIQNTGFKDFPISVSLFFPSKLEHNFEIHNYRVVVKPVI